MTRAPRNPRRDGVTGVPRTLVAVCALSLIVCSAWAAWPLRIPRVEMPALAAPALPAPPRLAAEVFATEAFRVPIWLASAEVDHPAEEPAPPPPPLRLQLLAILREGATYKAAFYDPDMDRLLIVAPGEAVAGRNVAAIEPNAVTLRDGERDRTLHLRESVSQ